MKAENENLWLSYCQLLQRRQSKRLQSWSLCIFQHNSSHLHCYLPFFLSAAPWRPQRSSAGLLCRKAPQVSREKAWLCYWTVQEAQRWAESQAIVSSLQLPVATFLWWRNAIASSQNLPAPFLVSATDVNVWGIREDILKKPFGTKRTKTQKSCLQVYSVTPDFFNTQQVFLFGKYGGATFYTPAINFL